MKKVLSVFVDESGDTGFIGEASKFYIIVFVFHDQKDDITPHLSKIADRPPFHIAPIIRKENEYKDIDVPTRVKMIRELFLFMTKVPIKIKTFVVRKREVNESRPKLLDRLTKEIYGFLIQNNDYFLSFNQINIYYDKGQQIVNQALAQSFGITGYNVLYKNNVKPQTFRLFQVADFVSTIKLIEFKMKNNELSKSEYKFFHNKREFKHNYLKAIERKKF